MTEGGFSDAHLGKTEAQCALLSLYQTPDGSALLRFLASLTGEVVISTQVVRAAA